jgi:predicted XRE-type DNA-binding protein
MTETKPNYFKIKSDLIKELNFWFQNPQLSEEQRIKALDALKKIVSEIKS